MATILIVDDEQSICWGLQRLGERLGHQTVAASSVEEAMEQHPRPDLVILDICLPGMDGLTGMSHLREVVGEAPIILITAHGNLNTAVEAVRRGAFEYVVKPFNLQQMESLISRALQSDTVGQEPVTAVEGFVGQTPVMQEVFNRLALAARSDAAVLLYGESGTGKELAAQAIHRFSRRSEGPLVVVNMAALSESLAESELFGHERGAFTGAETRREGLLRQAHGGTLFLDEVADIPLPLQVKLLRAIEQREVLAVGSSTPSPADFRIVAATHRNLLEMVEAGEFRHDLYFRLTTFQIEMPPLRQRVEDIIPLAQHCLAQLSTAPPALSEETCRELQRRQWCGNVRELRNAIQHGLIMSRGAEILPEHLPPPAPAAVFQADAEPPGVDEAKDADLDTILRQWTEAQLQSGAQDGDLYEAFLQLVEPPLLHTVLAHFNGQVTASARALGMHRTTLKKKLDQASARRKSTED